MAQQKTRKPSNLLIRRLPGLRGVVCDLDGTLIVSKYDWSAIRRELGVSGPSLIDALNELPEAQRSSAWSRLEKIEREHSRHAACAPKAPELIKLIRSSGLQTALVTNNTFENTSALLQRHELGPFDVVLTRDSGFYKPSGAPLRECARRLGFRPDQLMALGDSAYDLRSAREAGYAVVCLVGELPEVLQEDADVWFPDLGILRDLFQEFNDKRYP